MITDVLSSSRTEQSNHFCRRINVKEGKLRGRKGREDLVEAGTIERREMSTRLL